jgi:hypothetical protein
MWDALWEAFSEQELAILCRATADDMVQPDFDLSARVPVALRAKFMALVVGRMAAIPLPNLDSDPA